MLGQPIFAQQVAAEEGRIVRVQVDHQARLEVAAHRVFCERGAGSGPHVGAHANLDGYLPFRQNLHQLSIEVCGQSVTDAFRTDVQRTPDAFRPHGFARVRGEPESRLARLGIEIAKWLRAGAAFVSANTDTDDGGMLATHFGGLVKDTRGLFDTEVPHGIEYP